MNKNTPIAFSFEQLAVRVIANGDNPLFVAKDVCTALGISKYRDVVAKLDEDERVSTIVDTLGGKQEMITVTESGLYALVFKSDKPEAKRFRKWVTSEVIPSIRKTGTYGVADHKTLRAHYLHLRLLEQLQKPLPPEIRKQTYEQYRLVSEQIGIAPASLEAMTPKVPQNPYADILAGTHKNCVAIFMGARHAFGKPSAS